MFVVRMIGFKKLEFDDDYKKDFCVGQNAPKLR